MQTFLPYPDFAQSAACLDNKRLGKQRVEAKQIYLALTPPTYGWQNHPAVKMWRGYEWKLLVYTEVICREWQRRGFNDTILAWIPYEKCLANNPSYSFPEWFGNEAFHLSHQSNLVRKDPVHYRKYFPTVPDDLPYVWPTKS